jgi:hypothetical protein
VQPGYVVSYAGAYERFFYLIIAALSMKMHRFAGRAWRNCFTR